MADCPLTFSSPECPLQAPICWETVLLSILSGHYRYAHIMALRCDAVNPRLLGMKKVVSEDAGASRSGEDRRSGPACRGRELYPGAACARLAFCLAHPHGCRDRRSRVSIQVQQLLDLEKAQRIVPARHEEVRHINVERDIVDGYRVLSQWCGWALVRADSHGGGRWI